MKTLIKQSVEARIINGDTTALSEMGLYGLKYHRAISEAIDKAILGKNAPMLTAIKNVPNLSGRLYNRAKKALEMVEGKKNKAFSSMLVKEVLPEKQKLDAEKIGRLLSDLANGSYGDTGYSEKKVELLGMLWSLQGTDVAEFLKIASEGGNCKNAKAAFRKDTNYSTALYRVTVRAMPDLKQPELDNLMKLVEKCEIYSGYGKNQLAGAVSL